MKTRWKLLVLLTLVLVLGCYGDEAVDIGIDLGDGKLDIKVSGLQNPCELQTCPDGQTCTVVYHNGVLGIPVARCSPAEPHSQKEPDDPSSCVNFKLGSNVMHCKTSSEWTSVGQTQCALRESKDRPMLTNTQVEYACHSFDGSAEPVFLQAHFTCCPWLPDSTPTVKEDTIFEGQVQTEVENDTEVKEQKHYVILYPAVIAMAIIIALIIIMVAVWQRRRSKRSLKHPKVILATSFVNPSADHEDTPTYDICDEYNGQSDKSLLVINEFTPGN